MKQKRIVSRGFTLIELLVVISIIGLLSSVILVSVNTVRAKSQDATIKTQISQMARLMALEYTDNRSYANLSYQVWASHDSSCSALPAAGQYAAQLKQMCATIYKINPSPYAFYSGVQSTLPGANVSTFSLIAWLPGAGIYYCLGSSGQSSTDTGSGGTAWQNPGCYANP